MKMKSTHTHIAAIAILLLVACSSPETSLTEDIKEDKVATTVKIENDLLINSSSFAGITLGDEIAKHSSSLIKEEMRNGEGSFEIYRIKNQNEKIVGYLSASPKDASKVGSITIESPTAKTIEGIHLGSTFSELRTAYPTLKVHGSEIESRTYATIQNYSFRINTPNNTYEVDVDEVPVTAYVTEIVIA